MKALHRWDISPTEAVALQRELGGRVQVEPLSGPLRTVAGVDCAFTDGGKGIVAAAVLCDAETMEVLVRSQGRRACTFPYVPGLLSFREAPVILDALADLPARPDLLMCDGQGLAHPRRLGLATHVGLWVSFPTIGVAKSRLCGQHGDVPQARGGRADLTLDGEVIGAVLRTRDDVRPLYISVGNRITLDESVEWVLRAGRGIRLPEPTRLADKLVGRLKQT